MPEDAELRKSLPDTSESTVKMAINTDGPETFVEPTAILWTGARTFQKDGRVVRICGTAAISVGKTEGGLDTILFAVTAGLDAAARNPWPVQVTIPITSMLSRENIRIAVEGVFEELLRRELLTT